MNIDGLHLTDRAIVLVIAVALDFLLPTVPTKWHPVGWMGAFIGFARHHAPKSGRAKPFLAGVLVVTVGTLACGTAAFVIERSVSPRWIWWLLNVAALKAMFSIAGLSRAAREVEQALRRDDLKQARQRLSYHLVSRRTDDLSESQVAAATIESIAENSNDSVVAPLFFYALLGLPGAVVYRFLNTCDAMLGYRTSELEWLGKPAARLDDALNFVPARLTSLLMVATSPRCWMSVRTVARVWSRDRNRTLSPNAGQTMAMAAGILGVELEKQGEYQLGVGLPVPSTDRISSAVTLLWRTSLATVALAIIILQLMPFGE